MFEGKEITNETVEKLIALEKDELKSMLNQVSGVVRNGLKNKSITALVVAETLETFAKKVSDENGNE